MRKSTMLWLGLAAVCGAVLFHTSQKVTDGWQKLAAIERDSQKEEETLRVLQAEWSYLNQPDRLEKLARQHLGLTPMKGSQFAKIRDLDTPPVEETQKETPAEKPPAIVTAPPKLSPAAPQPIVKKATPVQPKTVQVLKPPASPNIAAPPQSAPAPPKQTDTASRSFGDVIKGLGVR